jgi:hypothetical protein
MSNKNKTRADMIFWMREIYYPFLLRNGFEKKYDDIEQKQWDHNFYRKKGSKIQTLGVQFARFNRPRLRICVGTADDSERIPNYKNMTETKPIEYYYHCRRRRTFEALPFGFIFSWFRYAMPFDIGGSYFRKRLAEKFIVLHQEIEAWFDGA